MDQLLQRDFSRLYHRLNQRKEEIPSAKAEPSLPKEMKPLDLQIKVIFDEDLTSMVFPKVQEIEFRVSRASPFEMTAKLLATQNGHMSEWTMYEFAFCKSISKDSQK